MAVASQNDDIPVLTERKYEKISKELRKLQFNNPGPQMRGTTSERESRRRVRSQQALPSQPPPSTQPPALESQRCAKKEGGLRREASEDLHSDLCDCLDPECPGCFLPCPKCGCNRCGSMCRVGRAWDYSEEISRETASDCEDW